jgi:LysM repeat protein
MHWKIFLATALLGSLAFQVVTTSAAQPDSMAVPFMTQFDGSKFAASDCGPASVAMAIDYATGEHFTPLQARQAIIQLPGGGYASNPDSGTAIGDLARVARAHKVEAFMGDGAASTGWSSARIRLHLSQGHPVIVLTRLSYLPGYKPGSTVDHYILLTGATSGGYVYNDPAISGGSKRTITEAQLQMAQRMSSIPGQGAAFAGPPSAAPAPAPAPAPTGPTQKVTVKVGDTLSQLAEHYGVTVQQIAALNRGTIFDVNHIEVGQAIKVPQPQDDPEPTAAPAESDAKPAAPTDPDDAKTPTSASGAQDAKTQPAVTDAKTPASTNDSKKPATAASVAPTPHTGGDGKSGPKIQ